MEKFGYCKHCGQAILVSISGAAEQDAYDEGAAAQCDCDGAKRERDIEAAKERLESVRGPECTDLGFLAAPEDVYQSTLDLFALMRNMKIDGFTPQLSDSTLSVKHASEGYKVARKRTVVLNG